MHKTKNKNYAFRITEKDLATIQKKAKKAKMTVTDYLTKSALEQQIVVIDALPQMISELKAIGRNLNQLTVLANMERLEVVHLDEFTEVLSNIHVRLRKLTEVL